MIGVGVALVAAAVGCGRQLPEYARGGELEKSLLTSHDMDGHSLAESVYDAPLDHFNTSVTGTVKVRYWVDDRCQKPNGPLFVHMGGEGPAMGAVCNEQAREMGAAVLQVEHRYYGNSLPNQGVPLSLENLAYLTVTQNLADTDAITRLVAEKLNASSAFAFGCSYSGATCAWFRQKYPKTVKGCISKSGVVNTIFEFTQFDTRNREALLVPNGQSCVSKVAQGTRVLEVHMQRDPKALKERFGATKLVGTPLGTSDFFYGVADALAMLDQYGNKNVVCDAMDKLPKSPTDDQLIDSFREIIWAQYGKDFLNGCFYDSECFKQETSPGMARQWRWQKCTQVAYLQSAPSQNSLRSTKFLTIDDLTKQCEHAFGVTPSQQRSMIAAFTADHWGKLPEEASNIFFMNYSDDEWQEASAKADLSPSLPFCMSTCNGCGHCGAGSTPVSTRTCDARADNYVKEWLKQ